MAPLAQLNLKLPPAVLAEWRSQAAAQGLSVRDWLLATLAPGAAGPGPAGGAAGGAQLAERVAQLEAAVAQLQAAPGRPPERVTPSIPPAGDAPSPERVSPSPEALPQTGELLPPPDAITTLELAERTGTNRAAWNNWAHPGRVGQVRRHPTAGPWRLVGKGEPSSGGPRRWLWAPADS